MTDTKSSISGSQRSTRRGSPGLRIAGVAVLLFLAIVLAAWIRSVTWERVTQLEEEFSAIQSERFLLGLHARESVLRMNAALLRFQLSGDTNEQASFLQIADALTNRFNRTFLELETPAERQLAAAFQKEFTRYSAGTAEMITRPVRPVRKDTSGQVHDVIQAKSRELVRLSEELVTAQNRAWIDFFDRSREALGSLRRMLWVSTVSLMVFAALMAALAYGTFVAPLRAMLTKSQEVLERHEKLASLGTLAAGVAHEIRNPLQAIKMRLFSFNRSLPSSLKSHEDLSVISTEINRLEKIVKDTLQFARPGEPEMAAVPAASLVNDVAQLLGGSLAKRGVRLEVEADDHTLVRADRQQIQQVLINLVLNGAESIRGEGLVTVKAKSDSTTIGARSQPIVKIEITDTGEGIAPDVERRIFDPFFSTKEGGAGLGLAIAARIVEKHGGFILYSAGQEKGTTFTLVLPQVINHDEGPGFTH